MFVALFAAIVFAQTPQAVDPFGPSIQYILSFGTLGAVVVGAILGRVDLRPSVMRAMYEDQKAMNLVLVATLDGNVPVMEASVRALKAATDEQATMRQEFNALRLELARSKGNV